MVKVILAIILIPFFLSLEACNLSLAADVTPPPGYQPPIKMEVTAEVTTGVIFPLMPPDQAKGKQIYTEKCAPCHGESGMGNGLRAVDLPNPVPALASHEVARGASPARWFEIVTQGNLDHFMPPFLNLSDRQRWDVVAYVMSLSDSNAALLSGKQLYQEECERCHGQGGSGDGVDASGLEIADFSSQEFMANKSAFDLYTAITNGVQPVMPGYRDSITDEDRWDLADYLHQFSIIPLSLETAEPPASLVSTQVLTSTLSVQGTIEATESLSNIVGIVSGKVFDPTGKALFQSTQVILHAFNQMQIIMTATTDVNQDGTFSFSEIELVPGRAFLASMNLDDVVYASDLTVVEEGESEINLPIHYFETTKDPAVLKADRLHYFFELLDENTLRVGELHVISNSSDKTLIASEDGGPVITFNLPAGASNLQFQDGTLGNRYIKTENGFGDTVPIRPGVGQYQVLFSYEMSFEKKLSLARPMIMPVEAVVMLAPKDSLKVEGREIQNTGSREVQGMAYDTYSGEALQTGDTFEVTLSGVSGSIAGGLSSSTTSTLLLGLAALGVSLVIGGGYMYWKTRPEKPLEEIKHQEIPAQYDKPEAVMDAILALDDLYQEGKLPTEAYQLRRSELKSHLKELIAESENRGG